MNQLQNPKENLRQNLDKQLPKLGIVGTSEASSWVPALDSRESLGVTTQVGSIGYIIESPRVEVENWVDEADGGLADSQTLLVDLDDVSGTNMERVEKRLELTRVMTDANNGLAKLDPKKWTSFPFK